ncbi:hypothetical protein KUD11_02025 [Roseovarius sp. LXJ103]|uniref:hypothetical protein n=1 Tax=Roseovarius carneus TaxID=2853164 RepID=UPI0015E800DB|nr:hypothetical protein [Roseovarius carneus]MBZ8117416.1 hypothetical protein [Roseovarius carneus]
MNATIKKQPRWMASALKAAEGDLLTLPFQRGKRRALVLRRAGPDVQSAALKTA